MRSRLLRLENRVALITGAASGIGRALAEALAARGCHLALVDRDAKGLTGLREVLKDCGVRVSLHAFDLRDRAASAALPAQVLAAHAHIDLLINNAGVALGGLFEQVSEEEFDWLLDINLHAPVRLTRLLLPVLRGSDDACIVNVSSIFGLIAPVGQAAYSASKFGLRGFSDALRHELEGSTVGVCLVCPGGVATSIADNARLAAGLDPALVETGRRRMAAMLRLAPGEAAQAIVAGIERRRPRVLIGSDARVASWLERLMPVSYWRIVKRRLGVEAMTRDRDLTR